MMYDTNQYGMAPRDRLDPRLFDRSASVSAEPQRRAAPACACGESLAARENAAPRMEQPADTSCVPTADDRMPALAMVYAPQQSWQNIYCEEDALTRGTIFAELDKPFYGPGCTGGGCNG